MWYSSLGVDSRNGSPIQPAGRESEFFHGDPANDGVRQRSIEKMSLRLPKPPQGTLRVLLHAIPSISLPPLAGAEKVATRKQIEETSDLLGHSLVYWVQDCLRAGLFDCGGRIFAISTRGSAARAVVEAHIRQLAADLAPAGITANAIRPGSTDAQRNPNRRLTMPEDVARCIAALCHPATYWMTGNTLHVDGGENIVG